MPELTNKVELLFKLGKAMSDYGQMLNDVTKYLKSVLADTDVELFRVMQEAASGADGWSLNRQDNEYAAKRRAMISVLNDLNDAARRYEAIKERLIHLIENKSANGDCQKARASLERLAEALESYYGVQLLEIAVDDDDHNNQKTL